MNGVTIVGQDTNAGLSSWVTEKRSGFMHTPRAGRLEALLADDLTQAVMQADGVDPASVKALMISVARERGLQGLAQAPGWPAPFQDRGRPRVITA
ncbi:MAG: hypothetical protein H7Z10_01770 [Gemmatimonadaceae bacterium]|nr:hypothetical protein [Acetobacteraceae bacterium]